MVKYLFKRVHASRTPSNPDEFHYRVLPDTQIYSSANPRFSQPNTMDRHNKAALEHRLRHWRRRHHQRWIRVTEFQHANTSYGFLEDPSTTNLPLGIPYSIPTGSHDSPYTFFNQYFSFHGFAVEATMAGTTQQLT